MEYKIGDVVITQTRAWKGTKKEKYIGIVEDPTPNCVNGIKTTAGNFNLNETRLATKRDLKSPQIKARMDVHLEHCQYEIKRCQKQAEIAQQKLEEAQLRYDQWMSVYSI